MLYRYTGSGGDEVLVAQMWSRMLELDHLHLVFGQHIQLSRMLEIAKESEFVYDLEGEQIVSAWWFSELMEGRSMGIWSDTPRNSKIRLFANTRKILDSVFEQVPAVMTMTKRPDLLPLWKAMGYTVLAQVPGLFPGNETGFIGLMTREDWVAKRRKTKAARHGEQLTFFDHSGDRAWLG